MKYSPLRYPGGKTRAIATLEKFIPKGQRSISSHFCGGCSFEIFLSQKTRIFAYDDFEPLIIFWNQLKNNKDILIKEIKRQIPLSRIQFTNIQKNIKTEKNPLLAATYFFVLNRASFNGTILNGGMSKNHPRFNESVIRFLESVDLKKLSFEKMDFEESVVLNKHNFKYLDPPYYKNQSLYGEGLSQKKFDHARLKKVLDNSSLWMLSYNDCQHIRELYSGYKIKTVSWSYGMGESKKSKEILIFA